MDLRINHILIYFNCNNLPIELKVLALYDIFRIQVFSENDIRLKILQTLAQLKYNEYVKALINSTGEISSEIMKTYEKWQSDYRDYRSIVAAFINASNLLETQKFDEAAPFFCVACEYNERITNNLQLLMKGIDHDFLLVTRRKCLKIWNQSVLGKFSHLNKLLSQKQAPLAHLDTPSSVHQELTGLIEMMTSKFLPCFFRLSSSTAEDKAMVEEIRGDWLTMLDSNFQEMQTFHDFMNKLFEDPITNHYHSLNVNKTNLATRYKETVQILNRLK